MTAIYNKTDKIVGLFPKCLKENILHLCKNGYTGLHPISVQDIQIASKPISYTEETDLSDLVTFAYHFKFRVPYAGKHLQWEVLFDPDNLGFAPDFYFNDENFPHCDVDEIFMELPSLTNWNVENPESLESVTREFVNLYKQYQIDALSKENIYSRIYNEYSVLLVEKGLSFEDLEILVENNAVNFLIQMKVDFKELPDYVLDMTFLQTLFNPKEELANLKVCFAKLDCSKVITSIQLSNRFIKLSKAVGELQLPSYTNESSLVEYIPLVSTTIQNYVKEIANHYQLRKEFILSLAENRGRRIVEYDAVSYTFASFLCEVDDVFTLVNVSIGDGFPKVKPTIELNSVYCFHSKTGQSCTENLKYYFKCTSEMTACDLVDQILFEIKRAIPRFKDHVHTHLR